MSHPVFFDNFVSTPEGPISGSIITCGHSDKYALTHAITGVAANDTDFQGPEYSVELSFRYASWWGHYFDPLNNDLNPNEHLDFFYRSNVDLTYPTLNSRKPDTSPFPWKVRIRPEAPSHGNMTVSGMFWTDSCPSGTIFSHSMTQDYDWHIVTITYKQSGQAAMYVDGSEVARVAAPCSNLTTTPQSGAVYLPDLFTGAFEVSEISFYNTELTSGRVMAHHTAWASDKAAAASGTVAPKTHPTLFMWYDMSQITDMVSGQQFTTYAATNTSLTGMCRDFSGHERALDNTLFATTQGPYYITSGHNGLPVCRTFLDGTNNGPEFSTLQPNLTRSYSYTIHAVMNPNITGSTTNGWFMDGNQETTFVLFMRLLSGGVRKWGFFDGTTLVMAPSSGGWQIFTWWIDNDTLKTKLYRNKVLVASGDYVGGISIGPSPALFFTSGADNFLVGDFGEWTVFTEAQNTTDLNAEIDRLNTKWSIF